MAFFVSWTCRGVRDHFDDIRLLISEFNPVCAAFQESYLKPTDSIKVRWYSCLWIDYTFGRRPSGKVALFTALNFPSYGMPLTTSLQATAVRVQLQKLIQSIPFIIFIACHVYQLERPYSPYYLAPQGVTVFR